MAMSTMYTWYKNDKGMCGIGRSRNGGKSELKFAKISLAIVYYLDF